MEHSLLYAIYFCPVSYVEVYPSQNFHSGLSNNDCYAEVFAINCNLKRGFDNGFTVKQSAAKKSIHFWEVPIQGVRYIEVSL